MALFCVGIILFILGKLAIIRPKIFIPFLISAIIFIALYGITLSRKFLIPTLHLNNKTESILFDDAGSGLLGLLPIVLTLYFIGKYSLKMDINEQWNGTFSFNSQSVKYGLIAGLRISAISLVVLFLMKQKFTFNIDLYSYAINLVTNLYEEIIVRGLLLACCVKYWNRILGVLWSSLVFGLMHGINEKALFIVLTSSLMAWAVLKAKSLWAGWLSHQTADMILDTVMP